VLIQSNRKHVARAEQSGFNEWNTRVHSFGSLVHGELLEIAKD
jgi:hypothetical protein